MRELLLVTHRWVALIAGIFLVIISVTGASIAWEPQIDRALNPGLWRTSSAGPSLPLDTLLARVKGAMPDAGFSLVLPSQASGRATVFMAARAGEVFVDPATGRLLGTRTTMQRNAGLARRLHILHTSLMGGEVGNFLVRWTTLLALYLVITGIVLWWRDKVLRVRMGASWKRINFDLHHLLGISSSIVLLFTVGTGVMMAFNPLNKAMMNAAGNSPLPDPAQPPADSATPTIPLERAAEVAHARMPGAALMSIAFPDKATRPLSVMMRYPDDRTPGGRSIVVVDRYRGTVLAALSLREARLGTRLVNIERPVHTGDIFGTPTLIIWTLASLMMAFQGLTGFLMWWNGRPARKAAAERESVVA